MAVAVPVPERAGGRQNGSWFRECRANGENAEAGDRQQHGNRGQHRNNDRLFHGVIRFTDWGTHRNAAPPIEHDTRASNGNSALQKARPKQSVTLRPTELPIIPGMSDSQRILIVDDDPDIRALLADFLGRHGYAVDTARNGAAMHTALARGHFDLIVLDIMMPGEDGLSLCRTLRAQTRIPVIFLTAAAEETDRIIGLEMGADDYLVKPFAPRELLARVRAVLRRASALVPVHRTDPAERLSFDGWQLAPGRRELYDARGALVSLTAGEFDLLVALARNAGYAANWRPIRPIRR
jgi:two-component system OmpR family response regulator